MSTGKTITNRSDTSRPVSRSEKSRFLVETGSFSHNNNKVWHSVGSRYKLCRLVHYDYDLSKRWYVIFYAWNDVSKKLIRKRIFDPINRQKTVEDRVTVASRIIKEINANLRAGKTLGEPIALENAEHSQILNFTLLEAIDYLIKNKEREKRRWNYTKRFTTLRTNLIKFYKAKRISDIPIREINTPFCRTFLEFIANGLSPRTFNNYRADLRTVLNFMQKRVKPHSLFAENPVNDVEKRRAVSKKHPAFSDDQMREIIAACKRVGQHQLVLFVQFMYYSLARPVELLALKVRDIDMVNSRILFRGEIAKNWRDEYVTISPRFREAIKQSGILDVDPMYYVFGSDMQPGPHPHTNQNRFGKRFKKILRDMSYLEKNPSYSLYGVKHSGAIALYLATKDIYAVKEQCRHTEISQTEAYLRDLGLLRKESPVMAWEGAI